ncbi:hypothetical protein [Carboxylicivirga sp. RSCT41]|uniref:hypothetical protein n=1 Tax=Carboxylicivirga agarovorans TaxID=3417570 RepID=UPI003D34E76D
MKNKKLYTLLEQKDNQELHLFNSWKDENGTCKVESTSLCGCMHFPEKSDTPLFICEDEENTRLLCAAKGRAVCEKCIGQLYKSEKVSHYDESLLEV